MLLRVRSFAGAAVLGGISLLTASCGDLQDPAPGAPVPVTQLAGQPVAEHPASSAEASGPETPAEGSGPAPEATPSAAFTRSVTLGWEPSHSGDVLGYRVYLIEGSTAKQQIIDAGLKTELALPLQIGETYAFTVTAYNIAGESLPPPFVYFNLSG